MRAYGPIGDMPLLNWDDGPVYALGTFACGLFVHAYLCEGATVNVLIAV
jgi:hypothetical protein